MQKRKRSIAFAVLCAALIIIVSMFSGFTQINQEDIVTSVLKQRTDILQDAFYSKITKEDAEKQLEKIETYPLLTEDIQQLRAWENTDMDFVKNMSVTNLCVKKNFLEYLTYEADILWEMRGFDSDYFMKGSYHIVMKKVNEEYKLSCFNPI